MTTCELCGEKEHEGKPCYADLRQEWKMKRVEEFFAQPRPYTVIEIPIYFNEQQFPRERTELTRADRCSHPTLEKGLNDSSAPRSVHAAAAHPFEV
jgi:hypothetical protein